MKCVWGVCGCVNKYFFIMCIIYYFCIMGAEQSQSSQSSQSSRSRSSHRTSHKWSRDAPKSIGDRSAVLSKCGRRCFLGPGKTFPICARLGSGMGTRSRACKVDPRGVAAAYSRAREWASITARKKGKKASRAHRRYTEVARRAKAILSKLHSR
jgi:hypothetical protein